MANPTKPRYRHCNPQECPEFYKQGKQVPCRAYELDLLHGRKRLTALEVKDGLSKPDEECRYQLPPPAQTSTKCTARPEAHTSLPDQLREQIEGVH